MNRDDYGDIDRTFFNLSESCTLTISDMSVVNIDSMCRLIDITAYDIELNNPMYISLSDIFDETEFADEYSNLSFMDDNYG